MSCSKYYNGPSTYNNERDVLTKQQQQKKKITKQTKSSNTNIILKDKLQDHHKCAICQHVMNTPIQTYRGNLACENCYLEGFRKTEGVCPIDHEPISPQQTFKDKAKEREIMNLGCYCCNKDRGCDWTGIIRDLQKHICDYEPITCSLCDEQYSKDNDKKHRLNCSSLINTGDCFYKSFGCNFEANTIDEMRKHIMEMETVHQMCQANYLKCQELTGKNEKVEEENKRLKETIGKMEKQMSENASDTKQQLAQFAQTLLEMKSKTLPKVTNVACKDQIDGEVVEKIKEITTSTTNNASNINDLDLRFQLHENTTHNGHLLWKINNFNKRRQEAITGKITALHSASCFTSQYGYKFCLRLYLNGDGMGKGSHLSLFLVIMKSEYDNVLQWPFKKQVKFTMINQRNRSLDVVEKMVPNEDSSSFQQPKKEMNIASGCPMLVEIQRLETEGFVKDDSIFFDIQIL